MYTRCQIEGIELEISSKELSAEIMIEHSF